MADLLDRPLWRCWRLALILIQPLQAELAVDPGEPCDHVWATGWKPEVNSLGWTNVTFSWFSVFGVLLLVSPLREFPAIKRWWTNVTKRAIQLWRTRNWKRLCGGHDTLVGSSIMGKGPRRGWLRRGWDSRSKWLLAEMSFCFYPYFYLNTAQMPVVIGCYEWVLLTLVSPSPNGLCNKLSPCYSQHPTIWKNQTCACNISGQASLSMPGACQTNDWKGDTDRQARTFVDVSIPK